MRFLLVLLVACGGGAPSEPEAEPAAEPAPSIDRAAILAAADAHDGVVDHVVSECSVCGLAMSGDPEHALTSGDYVLHMCSSTCQSHMEAHEEEVIANLGRLLDH